MHVHIRGEGLASWCCARLLSRSGFQVTVDPRTGRHSRLILIGAQTQGLLAELAGDPSLFASAPQVRKRMVAWGPDSVPQQFDHSAAIVNESALLDDLWLRTPYEAVENPADWTIASSPQADQQHFGSRLANIAHVDLHDARESCWIESFDRGWMFLIAGGDSSGYLISVGGGPETFLSSSRLIANQVVSVRPTEGEIAAYPRIASSMFGPGWLACGAAAMALDPLCGDGSGHAVREAILRRRRAARGRQRI